MWLVGDCRAGNAGGAGMTGLVHLTHVQFERSSGTALLISHLLCLCLIDYTFTIRITIRIIRGSCVGSS